MFCNVTPLPSHTHTIILSQYHAPFHVCGPHYHQTSMFVQYIVSSI